MKKEPVFFRRTDVIAVAVIVFAAGALLFFENKRPQAKTASAYLNSEKLFTVSLDEDKTFETDGAPGFVFEIQNGKIRIKTAPCKNQICVNTGFLSKRGQTAVCLPHKLLLRTDGSSDVDVTVG